MKICTGVKLQDVIIDVKFKFWKMSGILMSLGSKFTLSHWLCTGALPQRSDTALPVIMFSFNKIVTFDNAGGNFCVTVRACASVCVGVLKKLSMNLDEIFRVGLDDIWEGSKSIKFWNPCPERGVQSGLISDQLSSLCYTPPRCLTVPVYLRSSDEPTSDQQRNEDGWCKINPYLA